MSGTSVVKLFLAGCLLVAPALAAPRTALVVYGDSLSDNGNLWTALGFTFPAPPNFNGRRSNGPVAVETMAGALGLPLIDYAWIGATTGIGNYGDGGTTTSLGAISLPGVLTVFGMTNGALPGVIPGGIASGLFVIWAGANDFLAPSPSDPTLAEQVTRSISHINLVVATLMAAGAPATNILVPGMPDLGTTPYLRSLGPAAAAYGTLYTETFNAVLRATLPAGVMYFDTASVLHNMIANPGVYGFTNVTDMCFDGVTVCATPDTYLFWDEFHPTAATHSILGQQLAANIPEPGTAVVVMTGLVCLGLARSRLRL